MIYFMYRTIDLCAGIGGIRQGFFRTGGFRNVLSAEIDKYAAETYKLNFNGEDPLNDLTNPEFKDEAERAGCDVLLAGFPCQPFSSQGNKEGFEDPTKGTIFFHIKQIINRTRPKVIFLENVQNIVSHDEGRTIHVIIDSLEKKLNYKVIGVTYDEEGKFVIKHSKLVRNTKYFGLPQNRPRAFFIAFDRRLYDGLFEEIDDNLPTELWRTMRNNPLLNRSLNQLIEPNVDIHYYMSATYLNTLINHRNRNKKNGNGYGYCIVNDPNREQKTANTILATGGSGKERNLIIQQMPEYDPEDPVVKKKKGGLNNKNVRIMTPTEWGRLQGFIGYGFVDENGVDHFRFPENMPESQKYKQFGNSVSIPVIETMAYYILDCLEIFNEHKEKIILNYLGYYGKITKRKVKELFDISEEKATKLLHKMQRNNLVECSRRGRGAEYTLQD
jgi:DNA (cytosine-5)-methyltransferase 1